MTATHRPDPYRSFNFGVEFDGEVLGGFSEVSGLVAEPITIEYRHGAERTPVSRSLPGPHRVMHLTLKRGVVDRTVFRQWQAAGTGRCRATIVLYDESHRPVRRWQVGNALIVKFEGPTFSASGNEVALESLVLTHEGLEVVD